MDVVRNVFQSKWFSEQVEREAARDDMSPAERLGEAIALVGSAIVVAFFVIHQTRPTGFFTDDFGTAGAAVLYFMIGFGMLPPVFRLLLGRRNVARPLDALGMGTFGAGALYLLIVFPFDMSRFAQPLPHSLEFLLDWIPESLAKWVLAVGVVACVFFGPYTYQLHVSVKRLLSEGVSEEFSEDEPAA